MSITKEGDKQGTEMETNGEGQRRQERGMVQKGWVGNAYLKSDVSDDTPRIRKSYPCEDARRKAFSQKGQWKRCLFCLKE